MKILTKSIVVFMTTVLLFSCDTNKKLNQESAEKAIKEFVTQNSFGAGNWQEGSFSVNSITSIEPISQFSETEASSIVHFDFQDTYSANGKLVLKFNFKKNMDKKWVLTSVDAVSGVGSQGMSDKILKWQNVNMLAESTTSSFNSSSKEDYNYAEHSDFQTFLSDFKKAVNAGDKEAVAKMTEIPFNDKYREALSMVEGIGKSLTSNSIDEFNANFNKIFTSTVIQSLNSNTFINYESRDQLGNSSNDLKNGEFYLFSGNESEGLLFSKRNGRYKLICIPKYDMTIGYL